MQSIYIFKVNQYMRSEDLGKIREEIKRQIADGVVLLSGETYFIRRENEVCGQNVKVELVTLEADGQ